MNVRRIDLDRARREAKALLTAARAGEPEAQERLRELPGELRLATAQLAIARELGERSWPALVRRAELESATTRERADAFVRAATSDRIDHADALLERDPAIAQTLPAAALVLGAPVAVDPFVPLGPLSWLPLLYVTHSRYLGGERTDALVASAERLLEAGADPNGAYIHEEFGAQSALYGAAGIAHEPRLTRLLLERGASPDDNESVYHATEAPDQTCIRLLLDAGASVAGTNALAHALDREDLALVELLLEHGPAPGERWDERDRAIPWAIYRNRSARVVRLLAARGADLEALGAVLEASDLDRLIGACMRGDRDEAIARSTRDPGLVEAARVDLGEALMIAAGEGRVEATTLLVDVGAPIEARGELGGGPLHHAAWNGRGGTVDVLLRRGADPLAIAAQTNSTPLAWAAHGSRYARLHGDAFYGIGRRLVHEGDVRDPELADLATGRLSHWLAGREDEAAPAPALGAVDYGELHWRADIEGLRLLATLADVPSRTAGEGFAVRTGNLDNTLNGVVCDACDDEELADVLAWLDGRPAQWYVSERSELHEHLLAAGARAEVDSVVMGGAAGALLLDGPSPRHELREAEDEPDLDAWLGVAEDWGLVDGPVSRASLRRVLHGLALSPASRARLQIAWAGDLAIGAVSSRRLDEILLIEHLGVRAGSQRAGVGRALIAGAVRAEPGAEQVVLAPTPSSIAFYERLGFALQRYPPKRTYYTPARPGEDE
jgi:GNAT superfamily N-acetyltransferase